MTYSINPTLSTPASRKKAGFTHETTIGATVGDAAARAVLNSDLGQCAVRAS